MSGRSRGFAAGDLVWLHSLQIWGIIMRLTSPDMFDVVERYAWFEVFSGTGAVFVVPADEMRLRPPPVYSF